MAEHPTYGPWADQVIVLVRRALLHDDVEAVDPLGHLFAAINQDAQATVGVFATLVNRLATANLQARALANRGEDIHEVLLSPTDDPLVDHFVESTIFIATAVAAFGPNTPKATERVATLTRAYERLASDSQFADDNVRKIAILTLPALRLAMHEQLRGLDLSTVVN